MFGFAAPGTSVGAQNAPLPVVFPPARCWYSCVSAAVRCLPLRHYCLYFMYFCDFGQTAPKSVVYYTAGWCGTFSRVFSSNSPCSPPAAPSSLLLRSALSVCLILVFMWLHTAPCRKMGPVYQELRCVWRRNSGCLFASQRTLSQLRLQRYTAPTGYTYYFVCPSVRSTQALHICLFAVVSTCQREARQGHSLWQGGHR